MNDKIQQNNLDKLRNIVASSGAIQSELILGALKNPSLEFQAEVFSLISNQTNAARINPPLKMEDNLELIMTYLFRCISEDPQVNDADPNELIHSRWSATHELSNWFAWLWKQYPNDRSEVEKIKNKIKLLYLNGDQNLRKAILQGILEHIFENAAVVEMFSDWTTSESDIRAAYDQALAWAQGGGHSFLWD